MKKDSYKNLIDNNVEIYFITNNSSQTPYEIKEKLEKLLQSEIDINKIITPLNVLKKMYLNQTKNIYVYGSPNLKQFVESINLCLTNIDQAELILIGRKSELDLTEIELIKRSIKNGKQVLCSNKDLSKPNRLTNKSCCSSVNVVPIKAVRGEPGISLNIKKMIVATIHSTKSMYKNLLTIDQKSNIRLSTIFN